MNKEEGIIVKLIGGLKKQVEKTKNKEEAKEVIEKAGIELTDEELDQVTGGGRPIYLIPKNYN
jgi:bacteriocin-like protein